MTVTVERDRLLVEATTGDRAPRLAGIADRVTTLEGSIASRAGDGRCATTLTLPLGEPGRYSPV